MKELMSYAANNATKILDIEEWMEVWKPHISSKSPTVEIEGDQLSAIIFKDLSFVILIQKEKELLSYPSYAGDKDGLTLLRAIVRKSEVMQDESNP